VLAVAAVLLAVALYRNVVDAFDAALPTEEAPKVDFLAPSFTLETMSGGTLSVGGARDKALLINFWASWCDPCKLEAPDLVELYAKYKDKLDIYAVNATNDDKRANAEAFAAEYGYTFPVLWDRPKDEGSVVDLYGVLGYPTSFIVDKNGVIRHVVLGIRPKDELERMLRDAM
jgi:thiol-disulfide isomerase/thioredoxin